MRGRKTDSSMCLAGNILQGKGFYDLRTVKGPVERWGLFCMHRATPFPISGRPARPARPSAPTFRGAFFSPISGKSRHIPREKNAESVTKWINFCFAALFPGNTVFSCAQKCVIIHSSEPPAMAARFSGESAFPNPRMCLKGVSIPWLISLCKT